MPLTQSTVQRLQKLSRSPFLRQSRGTDHPHGNCPHKLRSFSTSPIHLSHYHTLSLPRNATKAQIKANFYKFSKMYHPDIADDPKAKEKFQAVSEAYSVLGDDRKRRAYDKTLGDPAVFARHSQRYGAPYETRRHKGATHAWEYTRPSFSSQRQSGPAHHHPGPGFAHQEHTYSRPSSNPFSSPYVQNATGKKAPPPSGYHHHHHRPQQNYRSDADRVAHISGLWRAFQVIGVVLLVATIGGGMGASAA